MRSKIPRSAGKQSQSEIASPVFQRGRNDRSRVKRTVGLDSDSIVCKIFLFKKGYGVNVMLAYGV